MQICTTNFLLKLHHDTLRQVSGVIEASRETLFEDMKRLHRDPDKLRHWLRQRLKTTKKEHLQSQKKDFEKALEQ